MIRNLDFNLRFPQDFHVMAQLLIWGFIFDMDGDNQKPFIISDFNYPCRSERGVQVLDDNFFRIIVFPD